MSTKHGQGGKPKVQGQEPAKSGAVSLTPKAGRRAAVVGYVARLLCVGWGWRCWQAGVLGRGHLQRSPRVEHNPKNREKAQEAQKSLSFAPLAPFRGCSVSARVSSLPPIRQ